MFRPPLPSPPPSPRQQTMMKGAGQDRWQQKNACFGKLPKKRPFEVLDDRMTAQILTFKWMERIVMKGIEVLNPVLLDQLHHNCNFIIIKRHTGAVGPLRSPPWDLMQGACWILLGGSPWRRTVAWWHGPPQ